MFADGRSQRSGSRRKCLFSFLAVNLEVTSAGEYRDAGLKCIELEKDAKLYKCARDGMGEKSWEMGLVDVEMELVRGSD